MKLAQWLTANERSKVSFANQIGVTPAYVTGLCADPPAWWPGRAVAKRIREATGGAVTPNDFLPPLDCQAAPAERGS
jgi:3,4-dihydroxy 2-butanone 4-phosphate synthase/GTP cyclohydrolase II